MVFGYSPQRAELVKNRLDSELGKIEDRVRHLVEIVPDAGATTVKAEAALEGLRGMVSDLQGLVDERTDHEAKV